MLSRNRSRHPLESAFLGIFTTILLYLFGLPLILTLILRGPAAFAPFSHFGGIEYFLPLVPLSVYLLIDDVRLAAGIFIVNVLASLAVAVALLALGGAL